MHKVPKKNEIKRKNFKRILGRYGLGMGRRTTVEIIDRE